MKALLLTAFATIVAAPAVAQPSQPQKAPAEANQINWALVDEALRRAGTTQSDGVRRYAFPRSDLKVTLDGVAIKPALALGSWLAFQPMGNQVMVMGDLVLTHDEVNPVMSELLKGGLTVTALHNHLLRNEPATMYMHVGGHGDPHALATALHSALAATKTPMQAPAKAAEAKLALDTAALDKIMGASGKVNGGVYQFGFARAEKLADGNMPAPASMGTATAINFQPTGGGKAAVTGDFVLTAKEVDPVLRALRSNGIEVTALHNHMLDDSPRLFFMHFWANNEAPKLARGLRAALDATAVTRTAALSAEPVDVVFVCEHGSAKSLVAALYLEKLARERGLAVRAVSRAVNPDRSVPPAIVEKLWRDGFDVSTFRPSAFRREDAAGAERVVAFAVAPAAGAVERWDDVSALSENYGKARDEIVAHVERLLDQLAGRPAPRT